MAEEESNCAGLGGLGPAESTQRVGTGENCLSAASILWAPVRKPARPSPSTRSRDSAIPGLRRSASMIRVLSPLWASAIAKLRAVVLFPSLAVALVINNTCGGRGAVESTTEVRRVLKDSDGADDGCFKSANSASPGFEVPLFRVSDRAGR